MRQSNRAIVGWAIPAIASARISASCSRARLDVDVRVLPDDDHRICRVDQLRRKVAVEVEEHPDARRLADHLADELHDVGLAVRDIVADHRAVKRQQHAVERQVSLDLGQAARFEDARRPRAEAVLPGWRTRTSRSPARARAALQSPRTSGSSFRRRSCLDRPGGPEVAPSGSRRSPSGAVRSCSSRWRGRPRRHEVAASRGNAQVVAARNAR